MLGRIMKIFIPSNLQRRPKIFKEFFMLNRIIKIFIPTILQRRPSIFTEIFFLGRMIKPFFQFCKDPGYLRSLFCMVE